MPIKTSSGKWKWGNVERSSKKELVQTVYGIWKKNGSKGSFSKFLKGTHESNEKLDLFRIPEDSMLDIYDIQEYKGSGFKEYNYLANCIGGEGTLFDDASEMASWINNFCQVIPIEKVKDRLNGAPSELVNVMKKLEQEEKLDDLDEIVCAIDAVKQGYHEPRDMMFIYVSDQDIHYFFECSGALSESLVSEKTFNLYSYKIDTDELWFHGTNLNIESFKTRPPTTDNVFYIAQNIKYSKKYGKNIYGIKLSDNLNPFNPADEKCLKDVERIFPEFVSFCWIYGIQAYIKGFDDKGQVKIPRGQWTPIDLLSFARDIFPSKKDKDYYEPFLQSVDYAPINTNSKIPEAFVQRMKQSFDEYLEWLKKNGCDDLIGSKKTIDGVEKIRKLLLKKLHENGYNAYFGIEIQGQTKSAIIGVFDISAIDKIGLYDSKKKDIAKESLVKEYWDKRGRYMYCADCHANLSKAPDDQYIMINDKLWSYVCKHGGKEIEEEDHLCRDCIEKRLGRKLTLKDLSDKINLPINDEFKKLLKRRKMKKESIGEAAMIHSYPETLQPIIDRIVKGNEDYELDYAYFNKEGKFIWMRNSKGYFHIFKPVKLKNVKWKPFAFRDLILQDDGMMKPLDLIQFNDGHEGLKYLQTNYHFNANTMI